MLVDLEQQREPVEQAAPAVDQVLQHEDPLVYVCNCRGFFNHVVEDMCLRCLDAYATGIEMLLSPKRRVVEMKRVGSALLRLLQDGPRVTVKSALDAADHGLAPRQRPTLELNTSSN